MDQDSTGYTHEGGYRVCTYTSVSSGKRPHTYVSVRLRKSRAVSVISGNTYLLHSSNIQPELEELVQPVSPLNTPWHIPSLVHQKFGFWGAGDCTICSRRSRGWNTPFDYSAGDVPQLSTRHSTSCCTEPEPCLLARLHADKHHEDT